MRLNRFDLNLLTALDALLHEKNVTRAGERVFLSQPAMSAALHKLREYFGDPLLVRVGRDLELTAQGLALVEPVRDMLKQAHVVLGTQAAFDVAGSNRIFTLMVPDFVVPWLMPRMLQRLTKSAPGLEIRTEGWSTSGLAKLTNGEIDLFITLDSPSILGLTSYPESFFSAQLRPLRWVCVASRDHPAVQGELTRDQFLNLPHIYARIHGNSRPMERAVWKQLHVKLDIRVIADNVMQIPFMIPGTPLLAVVPESLGRQLANCLAIRILELPQGLLPPSRVDLYWHRRSGTDLGHTWIRTLIADIAASGFQATT